KVEKCQMQLRDEEVRVVARIANQGQSLLVARQVPDRTLAEPDEQLVRVVDIVQAGLSHRTGAVNTFQIEARCAEVPKSFDILRFPQWRAVVRDVMGDELAEERPAGRNPWIVFSEAFIDT